MKAAGSTKCFPVLLSHHLTDLPFKDMALGAHLRWGICSSTPEGRWLLLVTGCTTPCALIHDISKQSKKSLAVAIWKGGWGGSSEKSVIQHEMPAFFSEVIRICVFSITETARSWGTVLVLPFSDTSKKKQNMFIWRSSKLAFTDWKLLTHKIKGYGPQDLSGLVIRSLNSIISRNERLEWGQKKVNERNREEKIWHAGNTRWKSSCLQ